MAMVCSPARNSIACLAFCEAASKKVALIYRALSVGKTSPESWINCVGNAKNRVVDSVVALQVDSAVARLADLAAAHQVVLVVKALVAVAVAAVMIEVKAVATEIAEVTGAKKTEVPKYDFPRTLPDDYKPLDLDADNQISFAEWPRSRRTDFASYDHNGDGYITPAEIRLPAFVTKTADEIVSEAMAARIIGGTMSGSTVASNLSATSASSGATPGSEGRDRGSRDRGGRGGPPQAGSSSGEDAITVEAKGYFDRLDTNRNGSVDPDEWSVSRRLKPLFEKVGADLTKSLTLEEFTVSYRKTK